MTNTAQNQVVKKEASFIDSIKEKVSKLQTSGEIKFPAEYVPANALSNAWLQLSEQTDRNGKPVTEVCSKASIASALMKMVVQGLSPIKNQCYFIPYGAQLQFQRSYQGSIALAKRVGKVKEVNANLIFDGDTYETVMNTHGVKSLIKHDSPFENRDDNNILGAYAVVVFEDGTSRLDEMTIQEIKRSWAQGATKGNSPAHNNFKGEMCKKTVINRSLKTIINSSSDSDLFDDDEDRISSEGPKIPNSANTEPLSFDDHEEVKETISESSQDPLPEKGKVLETVGANGTLFENGAANQKDPF